MAYPRVASLKTHDDFVSHLRDSDIEMPSDAEVESGDASPLAQSFEVHGQTVGNRWSILPMEGWDGTTDGLPTDLTRRRWRNFGLSGAKLIWGGEAVAVRHDGRANPNQLLLTDKNLSAIESLRQELVDEHESHFGRSDDLLVGLQLTRGSGASGKGRVSIRRCQTLPRVLGA